MRPRYFAPRRVKLAQLLLLLLLLAPGVERHRASAQSRTIPGTVTTTASAAASGSGKTAEGPVIGCVAEEFALPDIHGHLVRLRELRSGQNDDQAQAAEPRTPGQDAPAVVMLNFWAFWCDTWSAEMPSLRELSERRSDLNFRMAAISVDGARLPEFLRGTKDAPSPFPVLLDTGGRVSARYRIRHVPTVILLDRQGRVRYCAYGYPGNEVILNQIRKIINGSLRHE